LNAGSPSLWTDLLAIGCNLVAAPAQTPAGDNDIEQSEYLIPE
jgi:hypothetical protein